MDAEHKETYEHMLGLVPVEPTPAQLADKPYANPAMPGLPASLVALHDRYETYFRRLYNRGLERGHLPMIAAMAMELDRLTGPRNEVAKPNPGAPPGSIPKKKVA